jgi:SET domain-containing protein
MSGRRPSIRTNNEFAHSDRSPIHGRGLFARRDIPAGTDIVEYDGPRVTWEEGERLAEEGNVFVFRLDRRTCIDGGVKWNLGGAANHSCRPNARSVKSHGRIRLRALRLISKGEEITYDYGFDWRAGDEVACRCGQPACAGLIVAERSRRRADDA